MTVSHYLSTVVLGSYCISVVVLYGRSKAAPIYNLLRGLRWVGWWVCVWCACVCGGGGEARVGAEGLGGAGDGFHSPNMHDPSRGPI